MNTIQNYEYTAYMEKIVQKMINIPYCREELERKWNEVKKQKGTSGYDSRQKELKEMLSVSGIDYSNAKTDDDWDKCIQKAMDFLGRDQALYSMMYHAYKEFPTSVNYMERLVRRLGDPTFQNDSVRLAILKQFIQEIDYCTNPIINWAKQKYKFPSGLTAEELRKEVLKYIGEDIFDNLNTELTAQEWVEVYLTKITEDRLEQVKTSETKEFLDLFMKNGYEVNWSFFEKLHWLQDYLEAVPQDKRIEMEVLAFLKTAEKNMFQLFDGKLKDDESRKKYNQRKKDIGKRKRQKIDSNYKLLKLADDLSVGRFRKDEDMKTNLYLFALAFGMSVSSGESDPSFDPDTDIEKNLFHDFYQDNLLKYVSDDYRKNASVLEKEPSGEGINYKNFSETIFLYVIHHKKELTAREKEKIVEKLIMQCIQEAKNFSPQGMQNENLQITDIYREFFFEDILNLEEDDELITFLVENYEIPSDTNEKNIMKVASAQVTAMQSCKKLISDLKKEYGEMGSSLEIENMVKVQDFFEGCNIDREFGKVLEKLNDLLYIKAARGGRRQEGDKPVKFATAIWDEEQETVTRIDVIAANFYKYILSEQGEGLSLPDLYEDFCDEVNPKLEECRYQKISVKNIFDIFVILFLYRYFTSDCIGDYKG